MYAYLGLEFLLEYKDSVWYQTILYKRKKRNYTPSTYTRVQVVIGKATLWVELYNSLEEYITRQCTLTQRAF